MAPLPGTCTPTRAAVRADLPAMRARLPPRRPGASSHQESEPGTPSPAMHTFPKQVQHGLRLAVLCSVFRDVNVAHTRRVDDVLGAERRSFPERCRPYPGALTDAFGAPAQRGERPRVISCSSHGETVGARWWSP